MNPERTFVALVARGITPLSASFLVLLVALLIAVLFLIVLEVRKPKKPKKISQRIRERLGRPPAGPNSRALFEFEHPDVDQ